MGRVYVSEKEHDAIKDACDVVSTNFEQSDQEYIDIYGPVVETLQKLLIKIRRNA